MIHYDVRRATAEDSSFIRTVTQRSIRISAAGCYDVDELEAWATGGSEQQVGGTIRTTRTLVAVAGLEVVGWANLDGEDVGQLYVDPAHGGAGVARRLYESIEQLARTTGRRRLTATASLRAAPVFERFGFVEVARGARLFNGRSFEVVQMIKRLDGPGPTG
jgi:putative acetyltransferase